MSTKKPQGDNRNSLLKGASLIAAAAAAFAATPAMAQDDEDEAIVVTGTRIPQPNLYTTSPVTQVTQEDVTTQGVTRIEDLVNQLPQVFAAQNSTVSNGSDGTATVNLRGLGSARTLVLVNGLRMPYGSPNNSAADLNQIPSQLVERVEVLTGGASAVYGSDAVAGVVNFLMRDDFEGVEVDAQYGFYTHHNDFEGPGDIKLRDIIATRALTNPSQFALPPDNVDDGYSRSLSVIFGASTPDERGNVTAYATYVDNDAVLQRDRDYSACSLGNTSSAINTLSVPGRFTCGGSGTSYPGMFTDFSNYYFTINTATGNTFTNYSTSLNAYNFGPINYFQRPDERYSLGAFARYDITDNIEAYAQMMFTDSRTVAQIAPSGNFFSTNSINCDNPLLSAQQYNAIQCDLYPDPDPVNAGNQHILGYDPAPPAGYSGFGFYIGRRNVEGGGRQDDIHNESYRLVGGLRGQLTEGWDYDVNASFSSVTRSRVYLNDFSTVRLGRALDVITDPGDDGIIGTADDGGPVCRSVVDGTDPNCVPYNIFSIGGVTEAALAYLQTPGLQNATQTQQVVTGVINGDLGTIGLRSPMAESAAQAAFGIEFRRDRVDSVTDTAFSTGDLAGQGGATPGLAGTTEVFDVFAEVRFPLIENAALADLLSVDAAYRYSDYGSTTTDTYKAGLEWAPTEDIRFRASQQRAVRAANIVELFTVQGFNLFDIDEDPCGPAATATLAACQSTPGAGLAPWYGAGALDSPAGQYNFLQGGNPSLNPESSDTTTIGLVFTPRFLPSLVVSVDWFQIEIEDTISTFGAENTLNACYFSGDTDACNRIFRNPSGSLWLAGGYVQDLNINIGSLSTTGIDINANYAFDMGSAGNLTFGLVGTLLDELITEPGPGIDPYNCVGYFGSSCGTPNPEWRHRFRVGWETPFDGLEVTGTWRHYGEVDLFRGASTRIDYHFDAYNYYDLAARWPVFENTVIRGGVNNVLDEDPPLSASVGTTGNGNTYPQTYDAMGRYWFAGLTVQF